MVKLKKNCMPKKIFTKQRLALTKTRKKQYTILNENLTHLDNRTTVAANQVLKCIVQFILTTAGIYSTIGVKF